MLKACLALVLCCGLAKSQHPDTVYYNGRIVTMWSQHPIVQAVAISGDRFVAVGGNAGALRLAGKDTRIVNLRGHCVVPGLIEGHVHPIAAALSEIDGPRPVFHSIPEIQAYIREQVAK